MHALIRRAVTAFIFWRARRCVARVCPEIASIQTRDAKGRFVSPAKARRELIHRRLRLETSR